MSDYLWPKSVVSAYELRLLMAIRYVVDGDATGRFFKVKTIAWEVGPSIESEARITVPTFYHSHLRRFLWRQHLFMVLYTRAESLERFKLPTGLRVLLQRYIQYMDGMVEGLLTTVKRHRKNANFRSSLFDLYLITDYYLDGIHQPDLGDQWRLDHKEIILEKVAMESIDWHAHYSALDRDSPRWSGSAYDFDVKKIPKDDWKDLALMVASKFGFPDVKGVARTLGKRKRAVVELPEMVVESEDEPGDMEDTVAETSGAAQGMVHARDGICSPGTKKARRLLKNVESIPEAVCRTGPTAASVVVAPESLVDSAILQQVPPPIPTVLPNEPSPGQSIVMESPEVVTVHTPMGDIEPACMAEPPSGALPKTPDAPRMEGTHHAMTTDNEPGLLPAIALLDRAMGQPDDDIPEEADADVPELNFLDRAFMDV